MQQHRVEAKDVVRAVDLVALFEKFGIKTKRAGRLHKAVCPFHAEKTPSLMIWTGDDPHWHCYGCGAYGDAITLVEKVTHVSFVEALRSLSGESALPPTAKIERASSTRPEKAIRVAPFPQQWGEYKLEARHVYETLEGDIAYVKCRYRCGDKKRFLTGVPVNGTTNVSGTFSWSIGETERVLYRLPELDDAADDRLVFVVEGERKADVLTEGGLVATCALDGLWRDSYAEAIEGRHVVVCGDNDSTGLDKLLSMAHGMLKHAKSVRLIPKFPTCDGKGDDVLDWLAKGNTVEQLQELAISLRPISAKDLPEKIEREPQPHTRDEAALAAWRAENEKRDNEARRKLTRAVRAINPKLSSERATDLDERKRALEIRWRAYMQWAQALKRRNLDRNTLVELQRRLHALEEESRELLRRPGVRHRDDPFVMTSALCPFRPKLRETIALHLASPECSYAALEPL